MSDLSKAKIEHQQYINLQTIYQTASSDRDLAKEFSEKQSVLLKEYKAKNQRRGWNTVILIGALVLENAILIFSISK